MTTTAPSEQFSLSFGEDGPESPDYLTRQLVTYLGNKRALLDPIRAAIDVTQGRLGGRKLRTCDAFSGSGVVSRLLKQYSSEIVAIDTEYYAAAISKCYLANRSEVNEQAVRQAVEDLNRTAATAPCRDGFIRRLYAPADEDTISAADRVFYTVDNAHRLDTLRPAIDTYAESVRKMLFGPLLSAASIHANTAGVFKGFYKDSKTGIGQYGGSGSDALSRIKAPIVLSPPKLSEFECAYRVIQDDANTAIESAGDFDLIYIDPPYNQHPYGSNYFMLNLLMKYEEPLTISAVSGIPTDWTRSGYNIRRKSLPLLEDLVVKANAKFLLLSFNDEGYITPSELREMMSRHGQFTEFQTRYNTFRGSRNLAGRSAHVTEHLYLLEKGI